MKKLHKVSCHCGGVVGRVEAELTTGMECNCSICRRKGHLLAFVPASEFTLETARDNIAVYTFNAHRIRHQFCKICGCNPVSEGISPDGKSMCAINLRCVDGIDLNEVKITKFDGASLPLTG